MDRIKVAVMLGVYLWIICEENNIPVIPAARKLQSEMWYNLSRFSGRRGLVAENKYFASIENYRY